MTINTWFRIIAVFCLLGSSIYAQDNQQIRGVVHTTLDVNKNWHGTCWVVANKATTGDSNINLLCGPGYQSQTWWIDFLVWKQWNTSGGATGLNFRIGKELGKLSLYGEVGPILSKKVLYDFASIDYSLSKRFSLGVETENSHQKGTDSLGLGPRIGYNIAQWKNGAVNIATSYQFRRAEPNCFRVYLIFHFSLKPH